MNFLSQLQKSKRSLRHTTSVVTQPDGRRYTEENINNEYHVTSQTSSTGFVVDNQPDNIPVQIIPNLYLGSQDCCDLDILKQFNIKNILSMGIEPFVKNPELTYKFIKCYDLPEVNLLKLLRNQCVPFIDSVLEKNETILVHCNAGWSRAPSVVIGYLILKRNMKFNDAYELVKKCRPSIQPNTGFTKQLKSLEFEKND